MRRQRGLAISIYAIYSDPEFTSYSVSLFLGFMVIRFKPRHSERRILASLKKRQRLLHIILTLNDHKRIINSTRFLLT